MSKLSLSKYIEIKGAQKIADQLEVTRQTVYNWRNLVAFPPPEKMHQLIKFADGMLDFESICKPYCDHWYE